MSDTTSATPRDWVGLGFEQLRENGEDITIAVGRKIPGEADVRWFRVPHSECDGIGAITRLLREHRFPDSVRPGIKAGLRRPAWPRRVSAFFRYLSDAKPYRIAWRQYDPARAGDPGVLAWHAFGAEETAAIGRLAQAAKVSRNSWILWALHHSVPPRLVDHASEGRWLVPFNLRGAVRHLPDTANHAAFLTVDIRAGDAPARIHAVIQDQIRRDYHWGSWLSLNLIRWLGPAFIRRAQAKSIRTGKTWLGTFTNVGRWPPEETPPSAKDELDRGIEFLIPVAPVLRVLPISAGCIHWNGRLVLTLHLHAALGLTQAQAEALLAAWVLSVRG